MSSGCAKKVATIDDRMEKPEMSVRLLRGSLDGERWEYPLGFWVREEEKKSTYGE